MTFACAHRGDSSNHRENTVAGIASAIAAGSEIVEIDVRITRDGEVIVLHDSTLERLWGVSAAVSERDWSEISRLGDGENKIPLLRDVLELFVGTTATLMIDMELADPAELAYALVESAELAYALVESGPLAQEQITWCGHIDGMKKIRSLSPTARIWMPWNQLQLPTQSDIEDLNPEFINLHYSFINRKSVDAIHALGCKVSVWTVQDEATMRWAAAIGVDSITTDYLSTLQGVLASAPHFDTGAPVPCLIEEIDIDRAMVVASDLGKWSVMVCRFMSPGEMTLKANAADIVTAVDLMIETHVREVISANFPGHNFVGEEQGGVFIADTPSWYLDPVDGTTNFANGMPWSSFSLSLAHNRTPLLGVITDPWRDKVFEAERDRGAKCNGVAMTIEVQDAENPLCSRIVATELAAHKPWPGMLNLLEQLAENFCTMRIMGSGTLTLGGVAANYSVGAITGQYSPIDHLAAALIVHEAGGAVLDEKGEVNLFPESGGILCATQAASKPLYKIWMKAVAEGR